MDGKNTDKFYELVKRSTDTSLTPEENFQASIELGELRGVKNNLKTLEDIDKYFLN